MNGVLLCPVALDWRAIVVETDLEEGCWRSTGQFEPGSLSPRVGFLLGMRGNGEQCNLLQDSIYPTGTIFS